MELHKALRNIIQTDGPDIIKDVRTVNMLDDFQAYVDMPAAKYILRALIAEGFTQKLLNIGKWNNESRQLIGKFISNTGFSSELVETIFEALAYGLGWAEGNLSLEKKEGETLRNSLEKSEHMKFMGIPIAGSPKDFVSQLKKKGFKAISKKRVSELIESKEYGNIIFHDSNRRYLKGNFSMFTDCIIQIIVSPYIQEIYSVSVFPGINAWSECKSDYDDINSMLTRKYGSPSTYKYPDASLNRFESKEGWILLEMSGDANLDTVYSFEVSYYDKVRCDEHNRQENRVFESDL